MLSLNYVLVIFVYQLCVSEYAICVLLVYVFVFVFKQKTAYEMRISDWSSDVCSSDLNYLCLLNLEDAAQGGAARPQDLVPLALIARWAGATRDGDQIGRASCRERVCTYV